MILETTTVFLFWYNTAQWPAKLLCDCEFELLEDGGHFSGDGYESFLQNTVMKILRK